MNCSHCGAVEDAASRIQKDKRSHERNKLVIVCVTLLLAVTIVCGTVLGCFAVYKQQETIIEQQHALNMQYASLMEYLANAEVTTETIDGSGGGVAAKIEGDGNTISGGEVAGGQN